MAGVKSTQGGESKPHIGIYGRCNSGKSSLLNFIVGSEVALVSNRAGTTTDPVRKNYEILDFAPVVFIDTAGLDDNSALGVIRIKRSLETLMLIDLAIIVFVEWGETEEYIAKLLREENTPFILFYNSHNKILLAPSLRVKLHESYNAPLIEADITKGEHTSKELLLNMIKKALPENSYVMSSLFGNRVIRGDIVMLVCPIDSEAPSGRLILPQVQAIKDLLEHHAIAIVVQPDEIEKLLSSGITPSLVVTDSQVFADVTSLVPVNIEITSFSILLAQVKGDYNAYSDGLKKIDALENGDKILILENCVHQTSCEDIGRVKIPRLLVRHCGVKLDFTIISGLSPLPENLSSYALVIQCGGCMVTRSQLQNRIRAVQKAGVDITNYGMCLKLLTT